MTAWIRLNRRPLIALAVLVPAALAAALSISAFRYYGNQLLQAETIGLGDSGQYVPQRALPDEEDAKPPAASPPAVVTLDDYDVVSWDSDIGREVGLQEGSEAVSALIHIDATGLPDDVYGCDAILTAPGPSGERTWVVASSPDIDYYPSGDVSAYCDLASGEDFVWEAVFVVPEGVGDDADLFITRGGIRDERVLRLEH